jgi:hypothetical protein
VDRRGDVSPTRGRPGLARWLGEAACRPFDLAQGQLAEPDSLVEWKGHWQLCAAMESAAGLELGPQLVEETELHRPVRWGRTARSANGRPALAARIRRLWEAGEFVTMGRVVAGSMAVRGRVVGLELAGARAKS